MMNDDSNKNNMRRRSHNESNTVGLSVMNHAPTPYRQISTDIEIPCHAMDSAQRLKRDESRPYRSLHNRLLTIQQQLYEVFLEIFILRHVQLTADMCTHYADILVCLVEQLSYLGHCLTLKDKIAHINLCLR